MLKIKTIDKNASKGLSLLANLNRAISPGHVTKLAESIQKMGIIRPVVVSTFSFFNGKNETYIIDGQHLYTACLRLNIDIPVQEIRISNMKELVETIALLNASSKSWTLADYILSWQSVNKDYIKLNQLFTIYDLEISQIADLLHRGTIQRSSGGMCISKVIKKGEFRIQNEDEAVKIMDYITDTLKLIPRMDRVSNKLFISSYVQFYKQWGRGYNHKNFLAYLDKNKAKFILATQDPEEFQKLISKGI